MNLRAKWGGSGQDEKVSGHSLCTWDLGTKSTEQKCANELYETSVPGTHPEFMGGSPLEPHQPDLSKGGHGSVVSMFQLSSWFLFSSSHDFCKWICWVASRALIGFLVLVPHLFQPGNWIFSLTLIWVAPLAALKEKVGISPLGGKVPSLGDKGKSPSLSNPVDAFFPVCLRAPKKIW